MAQLVLDSEPSSPTASHSQLADEVSEAPTLKDKITSRLKGKEKASKPPIAEGAGSPFLNLPVDIIKDIINQVRIPHCRSRAS